MTSVTNSFVSSDTSENNSHVIIKEFIVIRHGQAMHNRRAEAARDAGCSNDEFFALMELDDSLDAPLTELGRQQAEKTRETLRNIFDHANNSTGTLIPQLVVGSPLSRVLQTADLVLPFEQYPHVKRLCREGLREINGRLLNGKRRSVQELKNLFPDWDFSTIENDEDTLWTPEHFEPYPDAGQRTFEAFLWLLRERHESSIVVVAHGGILRLLMNSHRQVEVLDERRHNQNAATQPEPQSSLRHVSDRFSNAEARRYRIAWYPCWNSIEEGVDTNATLPTKLPTLITPPTNEGGQIVMTEIDLIP